MKVVLTLHAAERGAVRCGVLPVALVTTVREVLSRGEGYTPNVAGRRDCTRREWWVAIDGPRGAGTAVCVENGSVFEIVTVRDASCATQGERAAPLRASIEEHLKNS